jgi:hypothetical protein
LDLRGADVPYQTTHRYGSHAIVRGIFPVNVPYLIPVAEFGRHEYYKILSPPSLLPTSDNDGHAGGENKVVMFKPNESVDAFR